MSFEWIVLERVYNGCSGCLSFYLVQPEDHAKVYCIINAHRFDGSIELIQLYSTKHDRDAERRNESTFVLHHKQLFHIFRERGIHFATAKMIPHVAKKLKKELDKYKSAKKIELLGSYFDEQAGMKLEQVKITL